MQAIKNTEIEGQKKKKQKEKMTKMEDLNPPLLTHILNVDMMMTATFPGDQLCARYLTCMTSSDLNNNSVR